MAGKESGSVITTSDFKPAAVVPVTAAHTNGNNGTSPVQAREVMRIEDVRKNYQMGEVGRAHV